MSRQRQRHLRSYEAPELNITSFLNLMVVLIPFLLISAVFSRVAIMELSIPTSAGGTQVQTPNLGIEVIVRKTGLEIANGQAVEAAIPMKQGAYDLEMLSEMLLRLKKLYPEKEDATILLEPDIPYDHLIRVMDTMRSKVIPADGIEAEELQTLILFPDISIGDAP